MQLVPMAVSRAHAAAGKMQEIRPLRPVRTQIKVSGIRKGRRSEIRLLRGKLLIVLHRRHSEVPGILKIQPVKTRIFQFRIPKQISAHAQYVAQIRIVGISLRKLMHIRLSPDHIGSCHAVHPFFHSFRKRNPVDPGKINAAAEAVINLIVVHGRLLPLAPVRIYLHPAGTLQPVKSYPDPFLRLFILRKRQSDLKKTAVFQNAPVALKSGISPLHHQPLGMGAQTGCKTIQKIFRDQLAASEIPDRLGPGLSAQSGLQHSPRSALCGLIERHPAHPVVNQPQEAFHIFFISCQPVCLPQTDKKTMPVKLPDEFRISLRFNAPVDLPFKDHRIIGSLHVPVQIEQKIILTDLIRHPEDMCCLLRPVLPAIFS